jgi:hypothetical protein
MIWPVAKRGVAIGGTFLTFYRYRPEQRSGEKYYLGNLPAKTGLCTLAATIKARGFASRSPADERRTRC